MSINRLRQIYNIWGVYAGPSPASGYHYADYNNVPHNNSQLTIFDTNLVQQIDRINSFSYGFNVDQTDLTQLGVRSLTDRLIVNRPAVQVNFSYWMVGVRNEARLGFAVNYPDVTGKPVFDEETCCIDNFTGQQTDYRNLFLAISPDNNDLNSSIEDIFHEGVDPANLFVLGFGNCYINSYQVRAEVGAIPQASVGYVCDNVMAYSSGSGVNIPAVFPKTGRLVDGVKFTIPRAESITDPSVIVPGDIIFKMVDFGVLTEDITVLSNSFNDVYTYNIQTHLYNDILVSGATGNESLILSSGINITGDNVFSGIYLFNATVNQYNQVFSSGTSGNEVLIIYSGITGATGSNVFNSLFLYNNTINSYNEIVATGFINDEYIVINSTGANSFFGITEVSDGLFGVSSSGMAVQSFDLSINLDREDLKGIGYVLPIDRILNFPVKASLNFAIRVGDNRSSSFVDIMEQNRNHSFLINMHLPGCDYVTGKPVAIQYKIRNCKLEGTNYNYNLNNDLIANFSFMSEIDITHDKGLFISGLFNAPFPEVLSHFLLLENGSGFLLMSGDPDQPFIVKDLSPS